MHVNITTKYQHLKR